MQVPHLHPTPRIDRGVLHWYAGDVFDLSLTLFLRREDGTRYPTRDTDRLRLEVFDATGQQVLCRAFAGTALLPGDSAYTVTLPVGYGDDAWSPPVGRYTYRLQLLSPQDAGEADYIAAVADNQICVEGDVCR